MSQGPLIKLKRYQKELYDNCPDQLLFLSFLYQQLQPPTWRKEEQACAKQEQKLKVIEPLIILKQFKPPDLLNLTILGILGEPDEHLL